MNTCKRIDKLDCCFSCKPIVKCKTMLAGNEFSRLVVVFGNHFFHFAICLLLFFLVGTNISCTLCRWCFDVELVFLCKWFGIPVIEISVNWTEIPGSKVNPLSIPNMLWELALMSMGYRTRMWKICSWDFSFGVYLWELFRSSWHFCSRVILTLD
jgi:hypothetical protein